MKTLIVLLAIYSTLSCAAGAQGLVGAAPDMRLGRSDERTLCADQGYEALKAGSVALTGVVAALVLCSSARMVRKNGKRALGKAIVLSTTAPTCSYFAGTVLLNNLWRWL